ncbi:fructose-1,6-bisphosphatase [Anaerolineales bacterium HSG24]|nr:fructose-1,6-bisphosphatase [Anaerolineales bacterium HSG24]
MEILERDYLRLLAKQFPSIREATTEIINLTAILNLPKGTEHFISDVHGEYEAFVHVLNNCSGSIRRKIDDIFANELLDKEKRDLATLIYYPERKIPLILQTLDDEDEWYRITLFRLIRVFKVASSKYTRSKVRKALPNDFAYIIEELLHEQASSQNKQEYYKSIVDTIISIDRAKEFLTAMALVIQRLAIDHLHILGDVYDRGPGGHIIMERLLEYHSVDFQWGNHDIVWMGAAAGSEACIANVVRICLRYSNLATLQDGYAINLMPLTSFAMEIYGDDPCEQFIIRKSDEREISENEWQIMAKMHKAIFIIQLKMEAQIIKRCPHYDMESRLLLDKIDHENGVVSIGSTNYPLNDVNFPTIDPLDPYKLTEKEQIVVDNLKLSFLHSRHLQEHVRFLYSKGNMYLVYNGNLLYHGCIPMEKDGSFRVFKLDGKTYTTRAFMERMERLARQAYFEIDDMEKKQYAQDAVWYMWIGEQSPLFGKDKMATFERYFVDDKETHKERKNYYYDYRDHEETAQAILSEFGVDPDKGHIINGHVPVKVKKGESPVKANGRLLVIDGGFSKAYQDKTGIAGYTLVYNSYGLILASHHPFESTDKAIAEGVDILSNAEILEINYNRIRVKDTDKGKQIQGEIDDLMALLKAYRDGFINEEN